MTFDWSQIEKYYDQGNTAGFILAILASEKLLRGVLKEKNFPGRDTEEKLGLARRYLSAPQMFDQSRHLTKAIMNLNFPNAITQTTSEQILKSYFTAITELSNVGAFEIRKSKLSFAASLWQKKITRLMLYVSVAAIAALALALFFNNTVLGKEIGSTLTSWSDMIFLRALPVAAGVITLVIIAVAISLNRKPKNANE